MYTHRDGDDFNFNKFLGRLRTYIIIWVGRTLPVKLRSVVQS